MSHELFNRIRRLDVLQDLLDDDSVTEIMVNGVDEIFAEREGRIAGCGIRFESKERLLDIISKIASGVNRTINLSSPILDARLPDGSRVNAVLDPVAINGPILTIRRFPKRPIDSEMLIRSNSITDEALDCLKSLVRAKYNILVSGSTGSGKTTLLNVLSGFIPSDERIITIEDSAELRIRGIRNLVRLETRSATANGSGEISIRDLIRSALRMRPDRIIVGEVRGEEAIDMLQAFNVGQDGSLSTIHANSAQDALSRLETMIMLSTQIPIEALRRQIISGVDIIVHLGRFRDGSRHVLEIKEMVKTGSDKIETRPLFEYRKGKLVGINELTYTGKLERQA
ncbi:MAG: CpaF family protein [Lachnospiraceae bacterium]|nr:CpaF family protein [Lachnospiraceae bacterium]